ERGLAHGHVDGLAGGRHGQAALQAFRGAHRDRAHDAVAELLLHFERQVGIDELQRLVDFRDRIAREFHVDDGADDLGDFAGCHDLNFLWNSLRPYTAAAPPTISASSVVIAAWRALL